MTETDILISEQDILDSEHAYIDCLDAIVFHSLQDLNDFLNQHLSKEKT